jgi:hypothetical protein
MLPAAARRSLPGRGGPPQFPPPLSERSAPLTPGSSSRLPSRIFTASMAFAVVLAARLSLAPPHGGYVNGAAGFASCYGPSGCFPHRAYDAGLRRRAFPPDAASLLPGLLAATRTGLPPASDGELTTDDHSLHPIDLQSLGAQNSTYSRRSHTVSTLKAGRGTEVECGRRGLR